MGHDGGGDDQELVARFEKVKVEGSKTGVK